MWLRRLVALGDPTNQSSQVLLFFSAFAFRLGDSHRVHHNKQDTNQCGSLDFHSH